MRAKIVISAVKPDELPHVVDVLAAGSKAVSVRSFGDFTFEVEVPWSEEQAHTQGPFMSEELTFRELNRRLIEEKNRDA